MRVFDMGPDMPRQHRNTKRESGRAWLSGLAITVTTLVALFGFWHLAPGATFIIACLALVGLVIAFWVAGGSD